MNPKILLAVDGSEVSAKAVKHVGEILHESAGGEITLFHVLAISTAVLEQGSWGDARRQARLGESLEEKRDRWVEENQHRIEEEIFAPARQVLYKNGVRESGTVIAAKTVTDGHRDASLAICQEVREGDYDVVVVGRRRRSWFWELLSGCVANEVIHNVGGCRDRAIWIVE